MSAPQTSVRPPPEIPAADRRSAPRVGVAYRVCLRCGSRELICHTSDVSLTGTFLETRDELAPGTPVHLSFAVGQVNAEGQVEVEGRVARWVSPASAAETGGIPGLGIEFTRFIWGAGTLRHALDQLLAGCRSAHFAGRRRSARVAVGLPICWGNTCKPTLAGFLTNLSASGAYFIESCMRVPVGTHLHLWFELPVHGEVQAVRAVAIVVRVTDASTDGEASGMGVQFEQSSIDRAVLQDFLDRRLSNGVAQAPPPPPGPWPRPARPAPAAAPAPISTPETARHGQQEEVRAATLERLFVEAVAVCEDEERRKRPPGGPPVDEDARPGDAPPASDATGVVSLKARSPASTSVDWPRVGRLALKVSGFMAALLLGTCATLILFLI
jgi:Tfp pilus assembly protein PilZ